MSILKGGTQTVNYLSFDGSNDYLKIDYSPSLNIGTNNFNVNFDAQIYDGGTNDFGILFSSNFFATAPFLAIYYGSGEMLIRVSSNGSNNQSFYRFPIDNELNNYDLTFNNTTDNWSVLVNGNSVSLELLDQDTVGDVNFTTDYYIGVEDSLATGDFLRFDLYSFQFTIGNNLVIDYDMSDGSGSTLTDLSGNGNNATIYGATWQETAQTQSYVYTIKDTNLSGNDHWDATTGTRNTSSIDWYYTDKIDIINNSIILDNTTDFTQIIFWDSNDNHLGFVNSPKDSYQSTASTFLGYVNDVNVSIPSGAAKFAIQAYRTNFSDQIIGVSLSNFQNNTISSQYSPAIDNIYYGGAIVENHLSFDGVDDYVNLNNFASVFSNLNDFILEVEFSTTDNSSGIINNIIFSAHDSSGGNIFRLGTGSNGGIYFNAANGTVDTEYGSGYNDGEWYTLKVEKNGSSVGVYVNESLVTNSPSFLNSMSSINRLSIGQEYDGNTLTDFFNGEIRYLSIVSNNITQLEYLFDEGSGTTLNDNVGNNDGTIVGATWESETLYPTIDRVYAGGALVFGTPPPGLYELIADVEVTSNTTQIDFDNLNFVKGESYYIEFDGYSEGDTHIFINDNTTNTNYQRQSFYPTGSNLVFNREDDSDFISGDSSGTNIFHAFNFISLSQDGYFVWQSSHNFQVGTSGMAILEYYGRSDFTVSSISKISLINTISNGIKNGTKIRLYKVAS